MPISIDFLSNVSRFLRGSKDVEGALDDVAGTLDDVARDSKQSADRMGDNYDRGAREVDRSTQRLEASFRDLARNADRDTRKVGDDLGDNVKRGTRKAEEGINEFKDEARSSGRESAASFRGEWSDVGEFIQESVANGLAGFGPLGLAAGLAGAVGIGLVTAELGKQGEKAEELKTALTDAYKEAAAEGRDYLGTAQIIAAANDIIFDTEGERSKKAAEQAKTLGIDYLTVVRAMAGDLDALKTVTEAAKQAEEDRLRVMAEDDSAAAALSVELQAVRDVAAEYEGLAAQHDTASEQARQAAAIEASLNQQQRDEIARTREVDRSRWEAAANRYGYNIPERVVTALELDDSAAVRALERFSQRRPKVYVEGRIVDRFGREIV